MPYTLKFSDSTKRNTVVVPDMPPGINTIDTSLSLVGPGYPNYGEKIAENFLHLLENFAAPLPPNNPIEGQLWYDTSDQYNKVLRIMDGSATSTRWPSANGIYQQDTEPHPTSTSSLKTGDIWVDTNNIQLNIYSGNSWTLVGPLSSSNAAKTGSEPSVIESNMSTLIAPAFYPVIKNYVGGDIVSIISKNTFVPKTVIEGFASITAGITLTTKYSEKFNGTALAASNLEINNAIFGASEFLRKSDTTSIGQIITGKISFQTPDNQSGSQGRDGIVINTVSNAATGNYIQLYKYAADAVLLNNTPGGKIVFKTVANSKSNLSNTLTIEHGTVGINTTTNALSPSLDVFGTAQISGTLTILSTSRNALAVAGGISVAHDIAVNNNLSVTGTTAIAGKLTVGSTISSGSIVEPAQHDVYDLGSSTKHFRSIYVSEIIGAGANISGMITAFAGAVPPTGWLLCNGASYAPSRYPVLFGIVQYTYGGSADMFNVPNLSTVTTVGGNHSINYIIKT